MNNNLSFFDTDHSCIQGIKNGDSHAIDVFVRKYYVDIFKYCLRRTGNTDTAKDLTQDTFVRFFSNFSNYHHYGKAKNYLYVIAGNLCKDYAKEINFLHLDYEIPDFEPKITSVDKITLQNSINKLPEEFKTVILLHYYQGLKLKEISKILNIGLPLVKYRLRQAKIMLKKEME